MNKTQPLIGFLILGLLLAGLALWLSDPAPAVQADPNVYFVTPGGAGPGTQSAPCDLPTALGLAAAGDTLYLAGGTYASAGDEVVRLTHSLTLYGGWDGAPAGPVVRDPTAHPAILDGQGARRVVRIDGPCTPTLDGLTIAHGNANNTSFHGGRGGGIHSWNADPIIQHCIIISNVGGITPTNGVGGGILMYGASAAALISGNQVLSNTAGIGGTGLGGGLSLHYSAAAVVSNVIQGNVAGTDRGGGGGLELCECSGTVQGNLIQGNVAHADVYGGGLRVAGGAPRILDNEIRGNRSDSNGGGVYINGGAPLVQGNRIAANAAGWHGGGLYTVGGRLTISANQIVSNTAGAGGTGGGLSLSTTDDFTVTNNVIAHNGWGGICLDTIHYGLIAHNTIVSNGGEGGIHLRYPYITPTIVNNIIVSNTVGVRAHEFASGTLDYNDGWGNGMDYNLPGALQPGPHSLPADPRLLNAAGDDYHLRADSPCIDAGLPLPWLTTDIDGRPRPSGAGYDIGAFEFTGQHMLYLPLVVRQAGP